MAKFQIQTASSTVNWTGKKVLGLHTGSISVESGSIELANQVIVGGEVNIDMTSITITDIEDRKTHDDFLAHLRNDDFFSVEKFKTAKLNITGSTRKDDNILSVDGDLTIKISHTLSVSLQKLKYLRTICIRWARLSSTEQSITSGMGPASSLKILGTNLFMTTSFFNLN